MISNIQMNRIDKEYIYSNTHLEDLNINKISHFINDKKYLFYPKENIVRLINTRLFGIKLTKK